MREIKFRAWDKENHCIYNDIDLRDFGNGQMEQQFSKDALELMQFTGLKDKNGKEIYEGDIIIVAEFTRAVKGEVVYEGATFTVKVIGSHNANLYGGKSVEVIGNIWENPELLKEE